MIKKLQAVENNASKIALQNGEEKKAKKAQKTCVRAHASTDPQGKQRSTEGRHRYFFEVIVVASGRVLAVSPLATSSANHKKVFMFLANHNAFTRNQCSS